MTNTFTFPTTPFSDLSREEINSNVFAMSHPDLYIAVVHQDFKAVFATKDYSKKEYDLHEFSPESLYTRIKKDFKL